MKLNANKLTSTFIVFFVLIYAFQALLFLAQASVFSNIYIGPRTIKTLLFLIALLSLFSLILKRESALKDSSSITLIVLYILFLITNFALIVFHDPNPNILPFLYNYSLTIVVLPWVILIWRDKNNLPSIDLFRSHIHMFYIFMIVSIIALYGAIIQESIFSGSYQILSNNDVIKFDRINNHIRLNSIFKSPIDYSYINGIFSSLFLLMYLKGMGRRYLFITLLMSIIQSLILVRSGLVMMMASYATILMMHFSFYRLIKISALVTPMLLILSIWVYISHPDLINTIFDSANLFIRLENWSNLMSDLDIFQLIFGLGRIQNGSFGQYHSIVIDNLYISIILTGGILSLFFFIVILIMYVNFLNKQCKNEFLFIWYIATLVGVLFSGIFENVMHSLYIAFVPLLFSFTKLSIRPGLERSGKIANNF